MSDKTEPKPKTPTKSFWCRIGIHKSDRDYGIRWYDKAVISTCERSCCKKQLVHPLLSWRAGGGD